MQIMAEMDIGNINVAICYPIQPNKVIKKAANCDSNISLWKLCVYSEQKTEVVSIF